MKKIVWIIVVVMTILSCQNRNDKPDSKNIKEDEREKRMAWWHDAKFGMFIHWGLYSIPADSEWHMRNRKKSIAEYSKYAGQFNPVKFDPNKWAELANDAGMKYMVITSKHHDGFALFDSDASSYNMVDATPFKRDVIKELSEACSKHDVRFGVYYSLMSDWGHPGGAIGEPAWDPEQIGNIDDYYNNIAIKQVEELLTNYGTISELWFDTDGPLKPTPVQQEMVYALTRSQPELVINNRATIGDFDIAEGHGYAQAPVSDFELCNKINSRSWGYCKYSNPDDIRPVSELLAELVEVVSMGGNYLLNVGPTEEGVISDYEMDRLKGIGRWMKINGEAIYGTEKSPIDYLPWGYSTLKNDTLFLHVIDWPKSGKINVPISNKVKSAWLLSDKSSLQYKSVDDKLEIELPAIAPDSIISVVALKVEGDIKPVHSLAYNKQSFGSMGHRNSRNAVDLDPYTYWDITTPSPAWLLVDLGEATTFNTVRIGYAGGKISKFSLKYLSHGKWENVFVDENLPGKYIKQFPEITTSKVWFSIDEFDSSQKCSLNSFEIFEAY